MAKRKNSIAPDKFRVGQSVRLAELKGGNWERANGEVGVVVGPKVEKVYPCGPLEGDGRSGTQSGARYAVRWKRGTNHFEESQLRAIYDGEELSTWDEFAKVTGLQITRQLADG